MKVMYGTPQILRIQSSEKEKTHNGIVLVGLPYFCSSFSIFAEDCQLHGGNAQLVYLIVGLNQTLNVFVECKNISMLVVM